jgi:hypothetical protein
MGNSRAFGESNIERWKSKLIFYICKHNNKTTQITNENVIIYKIWYIQNFWSLFHDKFGVMLINKIYSIIHANIQYQINNSNYAHFKTTQKSNLAMVFEGLKKQNKSSSK